MKFTNIIYFLGLDSMNLYGIINFMWRKTNDKSYIGYYEVIFSLIFLFFSGIYYQINIQLCVDKEWKITVFVFIPCQEKK